MALLTNPMDVGSVGKALVLAASWLNTGGSISLLTSRTTVESVG